MDSIDEIEKLRKDRQRYQWLANRLLACDYGDNDVGKIGWRVPHHQANVPFMFGASIDDAIDDAIDAEGKE